MSERERRASMAKNNAPIHYCPCCGEIFDCPCSSCDKECKSKFKFTSDGLGMICPCGYMTSIDHWEQISVMQIDEQRGLLWQKPLSE